MTGDLRKEEDVLDWMVEQKEDESIEEVNRAKLFEYIERKEFLAVIFCKLTEYPKIRCIVHLNSRIIFRSR